VTCCIFTTNAIVVISRILSWFFWPMSRIELLEQYAGVKEVSERLNIHPESVRRLIRQGKLPAIKFGNKWLVEKATLEQFASRYDPRPGNKATLL
jgi:excisionase family DNA binding protein